MAGAIRARDVRRGGGGRGVVGGVGGVTRRTSAGGFHL